MYVILLPVLAEVKSLCMKYQTKASFQDYNWLFSAIFVIFNYM